ncbi:MAG: TOBE domain-containing protein [Firmicutes bacterium]|nr:TOBE domain-containing protein [Bacillota bacterium]
MKISAKNQIKGSVVEIIEGAVNGIVKLNIGSGNIVTAMISMSSIRELGLTVGSPAYAVIKASSVMVAVD